MEGGSNQQATAENGETKSAADLNTTPTSKEEIERQLLKRLSKARRRKRNERRSASSASSVSSGQSEPSKAKTSRKSRRRRHLSPSCSSCSSTNSSASSTPSSCSSSSSCSSASDSKHKHKKRSKRHHRHHRRHGHGSTHHRRRHHHRRHKNKHKKTQKQVAVEMFQPALAGHGLVTAAATTTPPYIAGGQQIAGTQFPALYANAPPACMHAGSGSAAPVHSLLPSDQTSPHAVSRRISSHDQYRRRVTSSSSSESSSPDTSNLANSRSKRSSSRHKYSQRLSTPRRRYRDSMAISVYPGLPPPIVSGGFGPRGTFRHLPTKDLCDSDFSANSRAYVPARYNDGGWRSKMKKIRRHDSWESVDAKLIDCHCHLDFLFIKISYYGYIDDYFKVFSDAYLPSFDSLVTVFCNPISLLPDQFRIWSRILDSDRVYACCGIHPHASHYYTDEIKRNLIEALAHPKVRAVGECGIDRSHKNRIDLDIQARALKSQLKIALQMKKPVVLHAREAYKETLKVVKKILPTEHRIHLHCYTSSWDMAKEWMSYYTNVMFGFTPLLTFSSHPGVITTIEKLPLSRILLETDSPYFVPRELYQDTNLCHPGFVYSVAETVSKIKNISLNEVVAQTERNARAFYDMD